MTIGHTSKYFSFKKLIQKNFPHISYFFHVQRNLSEIKYDLSSCIQNHSDNCYSSEKIFPISGKNFSDQRKKFFRSVEKFFPNSSNCPDFGLMEKCALITRLCKPLSCPSKKFPKGALISILCKTLPYPSKKTAQKVP